MLGVCCSACADASPEDSSSSRMEGVAVAVQDSPIVTREFGKPATSVNNAAVDCPTPAADPILSKQVASDTTVTFNERDIGLTLDHGEGEKKLVVVIEMHKGGEADKWNMMNPDKQLRHGDRIVSVLGQFTAPQIIEVLKGPERPLELVIRRPVEFPVMLYKTPSCPLIGLGIAPSGKQSLMIKIVKEGMVAEWNKANPSTQIVTGDRIVAVNDVRNDAQKILEAIQTSETLNMVFSRHV